MLAEMARAFNIGLGLNGLGTNGGTSRIEGSTATGRTPEAPSDGPAEDQQQQPPTTAPPPIPIPPEGSFERFLVDLQVDLRRALTQPEDERQSRPSSVLSEAGNEASEDDHAVDDVTTSSGHDTAESTAPVDYSDSESESDVEHEDGMRFFCHWSIANYRLQISIRRMMVSLNHRRLRLPKVRSALVHRGGSIGGDYIVSPRSRRHVWPRTLLLEPQRIHIKLL